jgi:hypothetical protein
LLCRRKFQQNNLERFLLLFQPGLEIPIVGVGNLRVQVG